MKKILLIVAVMAMVATTAMGQATFGVKAGVNFASITGDDGEGMDGRTSMVLGGFAKFDVSEKFAIQPELLYSMQGGTEGDATLKMDYLNIPLMGKLYVSEGFSLQFGPQVGFLLSAKAEGEAEGIEVKVDVKDEFKGLDFGLNFGAGYELENGLGFDARYNLGLSNIADYDEADGGNGVFQITVGYAF